MKRLSIKLLFAIANDLIFLLYLHYKLPKSNFAILQRTIEAIA